MRPIISPRLTPLLLLWLAGACLRITVLATPPVIPALHADLHLTETQIGWLSSLPSMMFAIAAVPGSLLIARVGLIPALLVGLLLTALGGAARGAIPEAAFLFASTVVMAAGIAIMQPILPPLVRAWFPARIGFATAVYTTGLLVGEILPAGLTIPLVLPLTDGSWRLSFVFWALPVLLTAVIVAGYAKRVDGTKNAAPSANTMWWPDWRRPLIWQLGLILGSVNTIYFVSNAFLPDYVIAQGRPDLVGAALTALNVGQLPAAFLMLGLAGSLVTRPWAYAASGLASLLALIGMVMSHGVGIVVFAGLPRCVALDPGAGAAVDAERARRRAPPLGRHVHHQLQLRHAAVDRRRLAVGSHRHAGRELRTGRALHHRHCRPGIDGEECAAMPRETGRVL